MGQAPPSLISPQITAAQSLTDERRGAQLAEVARVIKLGLVQFISLSERQ